MDRSEFYARMHRFLAELRMEGTGERGSEGPPVDPDEDLFDTGLLTSLTVVRVIAALEEWSGAEVRVERHGMEEFFTLRRLYDVLTDTMARRE